MPIENIHPDWSKQNIEQYRQQLDGMTDEGLEAELEDLRRSYKDDSLDSRLKPLFFQCMRLVQETMEYRSKNP